MPTRPAKGQTWICRGATVKVLGWNVQCLQTGPRVIAIGFAQFSFSSPIGPDCPLHNLEVDRVVAKGCFNAMAGLVTYLLAHQPWNQFLFAKPEWLFPATLVGGKSGCYHI